MGPMSNKNTARRRYPAGPMGDAMRANQPGRATAIANAESLDLLAAISAALPDCGPTPTSGNWGTAGTAVHVRDQLREIARHMGLAVPS